jgi:hypothetical protein
MDATIHTEPQAHLGSLCRSLISKQENIHEFKWLLSQYPPNCDDDAEPPHAARVRERLDQCVRSWTGQPFSGFTVAQVQMWRAIVLDGRVNIAQSTWNEGGYRDSP